MGNVPILIVDEGGPGECSVPSEFVETPIADAEMVTELVQYRPADFVTQFALGETQFEMRATEYGDLIWHDCVVVDTSICQGDPFVEAEEAFALGVLFGGRVLFNDDDEVINLVQDPLGKRIEDFVDDLLEFVAIHRLIQPPRGACPVARRRGS
jgi:hypothetical protein